MNAFHQHPLSLPGKIALLLAAFALMLTACAPANLTGGQISVQVVLPTATAPAPAAPATTVAPVATAAPQSNAPYQLDYSALAKGLQSETVAAVPQSDNGPYWSAMPQYTRLTLQGYPVTGHLMQPQIFIYPLKDLASANEAAGKQAADLQELLKTRQANENQGLPFLPLYNAAQVLHTQVKYLNFKNGQGIRFLTEFDQAVLPVNNHELIYTYQGLSSDGKYYVSAVLPVNHPSLPASENLQETDWQQFNQDFPTYLANLVTSLNQQPANSFTPDLSQLDALMQSLEVH